MTITQDNRAIAAAVVAMAGFNGVFLSANGLFMLVNPSARYELVPGLTDTGIFKQHFIRDIGIIQLFIGVAFGLGMLLPERRIGLWAAATLWLSAHAIFHFWEVAVGICSPSVIPRDFPEVTLPAILGIVRPSGRSVAHARKGPPPPESNRSSASRSRTGPDAGNGRNGSSRAGRYDRSFAVNRDITQVRMPRH
jgi:hypothetical protein